MSRTTAIALTMVATLSMACSKKESYSDSTAGATTAATPPPPPAPPALTDPNIVYILDQANAADSARGKLAETKGTNAEVKRFGRLMVGEHHGLRVAGQALAKKLNVTPLEPAGDQSVAQATQEMDALTAEAKGKAWDKAYIDYEVTYHQAVLETATKALGAAQNAELKNLIQTAAPVIQRHLDMAKQIQGKLQ